MCEVRALHHRSSELHHHHLLRQRSRQSELEHPRIWIGQPVILDQILGHDVRRQNRAARAHNARVRHRPLRNQRQIAGLRAQRLHPQSTGDGRCFHHHVELRLHLLVDQVQQHRVRINRRRLHLIRRTRHHVRDRRLQPVHDARAHRNRRRISAGLNLSDHAEILLRRRRTQRSIVAAPQRHIVRSQQSIDRVRQVLRLQISEL